MPDRRIRPSTVLPSPRRWDLFCRVIDNFGDIGVSLRLARDLAQRGEQVRLWCDDLSPLAWMQPEPVPGLTCLPWSQSETVTAEAVGDVVIETFGCDLPQAFVAAMARRSVAPSWINLEYLSAEDYVERSHGLSSPQFSGPGAGLEKRFFYPGFTERTGGLLREPSLMTEIDRHDRHAWLAARGWAPRDGERVLSLFAYPDAPIERLMAALEGPWLLLLCPGAAQQDVPPLLRDGQRAIALPALPQPAYDRLLWSCDLNLARGEDSFVRAQWAGQPLLWHIYPQADGAHAPKLEAFLQLSMSGADQELETDWTALSRAWNGLDAWNEHASQALRRLPEAAAQARGWRAKLTAQADLATQLQGFTWRPRGH